MDEARLAELSERLSQLNSEQIQTALAEEQSVLTLPEVDEILVIASIFRGAAEDLQAEVRRLRALLDSANDTIEVLDYQVQTR
jgi:hypothetical protein